MFVKSTTYGKIETAQNDACNIALNLTNSSIKEINMAKSNLPNNQSTFKACSVEGCPKPVLARRLCSAHYSRLIRQNSAPKLVYKTSTKKRFWSKVAITANPDKCWEWQASIAGDGYGGFAGEGTGFRAHRFAFLITNGFLPKLVRHTCDNRLCVNPKHLISGTALENMRDCVERNRIARGEQNGRAKLTEKEVLQIRAIEGKMAAKDIALKFRISKSQVNDILKRRKWTHI